MKKNYHFDIAKQIADVSVSVGMIADLTPWSSAAVDDDPILVLRVFKYNFIHYFLFLFWCNGNG